MLSFFEWLKQKSITEIRVLDAHAQPSQSAERDIGRDANWTIACLIEKITGWKVTVYPIGSREDVVDKVDAVFASGPHIGEKIQISRRIAMGARDDYQIPLVKNILLSDLTNNDIRTLVNRSDSKFASLAKWFVMLNANDDKIFMSDIANIKDEVYDTIGRMEEDPTFEGRLKGFSDRYVDRTNNVHIRVASGIARSISLIAYVPADIVAENIYDVDVNKIAECEEKIQKEKEEKEAAQRKEEEEREAKRKLSDIELAIKQAKDTGTASLKVVGNKNAIDTKLRKIRAAASANRIRVDVKPDGTVTLINM